jgi:hypothetical protein
MRVVHMRKGVAAALLSLAFLGVLVSSSHGRAQDWRDHDQKCDKRKIDIGFRVAPVPLNLKGKDEELVGLGSYIVNAENDCNFCHTGGTTPPNFNFLPGHNPYFGQPKKTDPATYLAGGTPFGTVGTPTGPNNYAGPVIVSRNLTPDKTGLPEGGHTLKQFLEIIRTGVDRDHQHPTCTAAQIKEIENGATPNCIPTSPGNTVDGNLLQVMPWPDFQDMTEHDLRAIFEYLSAIPCIAGPPAPSPLHNDCGDDQTVSTDNASEAPHGSRRRQ